MKYVPECEALAPYLKEKLLIDSEHTWRDAPYIHEEVRAAIAQSEYQHNHSYPQQLQRNAER